MGNRIVKNYFYLTALLTFCVLFTSCNSNRTDFQHLLIEAESFENKGGWVVDPQFVEQMGSPYLLAHGLGSPVENARTIIHFPAKGKYHVWARTKDWVPGDWYAPGRFKIIVDNVKLKHNLGTNKNWNWRGLSRNPNITWEIVQANPDKPW